jgi:hypothetical protein
MTRRRRARYLRLSPTTEGDEHDFRGVLVAKGGTRFSELENQKQTTALATKPQPGLRSVQLVPSH